MPTSGDFADRKKASKEAESSSSDAPTKPSDRPSDIMTSTTTRFSDTFGCKEIGMRATQQIWPVTRRSNVLVRPVEERDVTDWSRQQDWQSQVGNAVGRMRGILDARPRKFVLQIIGREGRPSSSSELRRVKA